jgi:hypothetical protein
MAVLAQACERARAGLGAHGMPVMKAVAAPAGGAAED